MTVDIEQVGIISEIAQYRENIATLKSGILISKSREPGRTSIWQEFAPNTPIADQIASSEPFSQIKFWMPEKSPLLLQTIDETKKGIVRGGSAHGVGFAEAVLYDAETRKQSRETVVYKPFQDPAKAIKELVNHQLVRYQGVDTVFPICVLITTKNSGYFLSLFRGDLQTLDLENWPTYTNKGIKSTTTDRLSKIATLLADFHINGISHQDTQMKNFAIIPTGKVIAFDWESAKIYDNSQRVKDTTIFRYAGHDLKVLFSSLTRSRKNHGVGFFANLTRQARWQAFNQLIFTPYINFWANMIDQNEEILGNPEHEITQMLSDLETDMKKFTEDYSPTLH
ncbi:hypothetical protein KW795_02085 [Candidatus Microgenomates bacterium]|nr:hypothetical protein [Candidatus Microgenomates bacterium]